MTRVLVSSGNFKKSYAVFRSLHRHGMEVAATFYVDRGGRPLVAPNIFSKYLDARYLVASPSWSERGYVLGVVDAALDFAADVVLPTGFTDFLALSKYKSLVEGVTGARLASPEYERIVAASDKTRLPGLAASLGLLSPKTLYFGDRSVSVEDVARAIRRELKPPYVVKGVGDASRPAFYKDADEAARDAASRRGIVQEFIAGGGYGYFTLAVEGKPVLEFMHRRVVEAGPLGGPSLMASSFLDSELLSLGRRLVAALEWSGVLMAEFKRDYETGDYYLLELNPKFWGSLDLAVEALADFPALLVKAVLGEELPHAVVGRRLTFSWLVYTVYKYASRDLRFLYRFFKETLRRRARVDVWVGDPAVTFRVLTMTVATCLHRGGRRRPGVELADLAALLPGGATLSFDLDGTLVNLPVRWREVRREAANLGLLRGATGLMATMYRLGRAGRRREALELHELVKRYEVEAASRVERNERLVERLEELRRLAGRLRLLLVTKQSREAALIALDRLGVRRLFDRVISREDSLLREEQLRIAAGDVGSRLVHAGDTLVDVVSAFRVGAFPVLVTRDVYGIRQALELRVLAFKSVEELIGTLIRLVEARHEHYRLRSGSDSYKPLNKS